MIELQNLTAAYGSREILHGITLSLAPGTVTTVLGPNGSGKSTLLKVLAGQLPYGGSLTVAGSQVNSLSPGALAKKVAYLSQGHSVPDITAGRLVLHGRFPYLRYPRHYSREDHAAAREAMAQLGIEDLADAPMETLSGGTRQKVYIAMALAQQTPVILMDEPTAYLDMGQQIRFAQTARELARRGKTVVLVLHDIPLALRLSDRLAVLRDGCLPGSGTPAQILESGVLSQLYGVELCPVAGEDPVQYYYRIP